jgi:hypothetical protein
MSSVERSSDKIEERSEVGLSYGLGGLALMAFGGMLWYFNKDGGSLLLFSYICLLGGLGCAGYGVNSLWQIRKVKSFAYDCPYCKYTNRLSAEPETDFTCVDCHRLIPVQDHKVLSVHRVLCGYCQEPNWYSDKTNVLLCESCNHEIPITRGDGSIVHSKFAVHDDTRTYELSLTGYQHATEELISCLQQMLALNRNQVKDMLTSLPAVLLTGIPKKKAEMLAAQLSAHGAAADYHAI